MRGKNELRPRGGWRSVFSARGDGRRRLTADEVNVYIGVETHFRGVLNFEKTAVIDGYLNGEVISHDVLIVGEGAVVEANIDVGTLIARGRIYGNVHASERVELRKTCQLVGNIKSPVLHIEQGALFEGSNEILKPEGESMAPAETGAGEIRALAGGTE